ncbi:TIM barrel protein [Candidatus Latescibacterota bacterium]
MEPCNSLLFGTAGTPHSAEPHDSASACRRLRELGLDAMEIEYVRGSFPSEDRCKEVREAAVRHGIRLTAHGPYYINLNAADPEKLRASRKRIINTAYYGGLSGAQSITFHAGFFMKDEPEAVYTRIRDELQDILQKVRDRGIMIDIRPELTGKPTQFGSLEDLLRLAGDIPDVSPCIDWSHFYARSGTKNSGAAFQKVLDTVRDVLGDEALHQMHMHLSGISFGSKGEKKHLDLKESDINYRDLLSVLKANDVRGILICESPSLEGDALILKEFYKSLP